MIQVAISRMARTMFEGWQGMPGPNQIPVHLYRVPSQPIPMEKKQQATRVKHDCQICEQCQGSSIKTRPDGSYRCNNCGYDSAKGKK